MNNMAMTDLDERSEAPSPAELERQYKEARSTLDASIARAKSLSLYVAGRQVSHAKYIWASVIYTRLVVTGETILSLVPRTGGPTANRNSHWDFSSIASLTRNFIECYFVLFYLCSDRMADEDEWEMRMELIQLRDNKDRWRMIEEWSPDDPQLSEFAAEHEKLSAKLKSRRQFSALPQKLQNQLLRGTRLHLTQDEMLARMVNPPDGFRGLYRFFSAHTHSFPLSFYRMIEHDRGRGMENYVDKGYMAVAIRLVADFMNRASDDMIMLFPDADPKVRGEPTRIERRRLRKRRRW